MRLEQFRYHLPPEAIAQEPAEPRDAARLLVHEVGAGATRHRIVSALPEELRAGDLLVLNDTRVRPVRILARRPSGGRVEVLLVEAVGDGPEGGSRWRAMLRPARRPRPGEELRAEGGLTVRALEREGESAFWTVALGGCDEPLQVLERTGRMPLPPYIERDPEGDPRDALDRERYQTVYAREPGAVAAPTAGLHLTEDLLGAMEERGVERAVVTLHVGAGTFLPVTTPRVEDHRMHAERFTVPAETAAAVAGCRRRGGRVIAVGTTSVRALESACDEDGVVGEREGETRLFLKPGDRMRAVDGLLTNFHLPGSTLLMLVCALAGRERVLGLYREAVAAGYRFYSYGDAMLLLP